MGNGETEAQRDGGTRIRHPLGPCRPPVSPSPRLPLSPSLLSPVPPFPPPPVPASILHHRYYHILSTLLLLLFISTLTSCTRLGYILHATTGQIRLLGGAVPISEGLKSDTLTPEQKDRLRLVAEIKAYGEKELGLKETENYETVYLKTRRRPIYVVSAAPKDRLELISWWFPVVGNMPYLGFFDLQKAKAEVESLMGKNLDVTLGTAEAYSTLGWFQDPVTMNLLLGSELDLVETILHEMTHTTLYVKSQSAFNEGLAVLVGKRGAMQFLEKTYGPTHPLTLEAGASVADEKIFSRFIDRLLMDLEGLYGSPVSYEEKLAGRERIFSGARDEFKEVSNTLRTDRFTAFGRASLNNAYLLSIGLYHRHFNLFEAVYRKKGPSLKDVLLYFKGLAKEEGDLIEKMRTEGVYSKK